MKVLTPAKQGAAPDRLQPALRSFLPTLRLPAGVDLVVRRFHLGFGYTMNMKQRYIYWQDEDVWLGYLEEFPDHWTQGESEDELRENLIDIYRELSSGNLPNVRRVTELEVA